MDDVAKSCLQMCRDASERCERAQDVELMAWAEEDTLLGLFAQKELVYRDQVRVIDAEGANHA